MTIEGVDYSVARPSPSGLFSAGKRFACRYHSFPRSGTTAVNPKCLTREEAKALTSAGLSIVSNWEYAAGDAKGGYAIGVRNATEALKQATACGKPINRPIYFSVDFSPSSSDWASIREYFRGIRSVVGYGNAGVYGGYATVKMAKTEGWCKWLWQTYAWSNRLWLDGVHIQQYQNGVTLLGADCDLDRALMVDFGQWGLDKPPARKADEMITTQVKGSTAIYRTNGNGCVHITMNSAYQKLHAAGVVHVVFDTQAEMESACGKIVA